MACLKCSIGNYIEISTSWTLLYNCTFYELFN